jgi:hypothetical protein
MLSSFLIDNGYDVVDKLVGLLKRINRDISDANMALGVSYFLRPQLAAELPDLWRYEVEPYLAEVWFDQPAQFEEYRWDAVHHALATKPAKRSR